MSAPDNPRTRRVAVLAVHGVADQPEHSTARAAADLLLATGSYAPFTETQVRIDVQEVPVRDDPHAGGVAHEFTRRLLRSLELSPAERVYHSIRLSGERAGRDATTRVDIYELHWADLSRVGPGALQVFGEMYQVLLHMCRLGRLAVLHAVQSQAPGGGRKAWLFAQEAAAWWLAVPIALLNLWLAAATAVVLVGAVPAGAQRRVAAVGLALAVLGGSAFFALVLTPKLRRIGWFLLAGLSFALVAFLVRVVAHLDSGSLTRLLAYEASVLSAALAGFLTHLYAKRRPEAARAGLAIGALLFALYWSRLASVEGPHVVWFAGLAAAEVGVYALMASWALFFLTCLLLFPLGGMAVMSFPPEARPAARAAAQTGRLAIAIPAAVFLPLTLSLWAGAFVALFKVVTPPKGYEPLLAWGGFPDDKPGDDSLAHFLHHLLFGPFRYTGAVPAILLIGVALAIVLWAVLPLALAEMRLPRGGAPAEKRYGAWLDRGFDLCGLASRLIMLAVFVVWSVTPVLPAAGAFASVGGRLGIDAAAHALTPAGVFLFATLLGLSIFRGPLEKLALGYRPIVDVALDVDNHLREHPRDSNPRGEFSARLHSLLAHIVGDRDPLTGAGYDHLVVIAHSQGSVITADLLRFLHFEDRPLPLPVRLLTMGSPLRQLYSRRFPHLYEWAAVPDPGVLDAARWVNLYRSGDYVGRDLWPDGPPARAEEACVGPGAHTRYWDGSAPKVAAKLDELVT